MAFSAPKLFLPKRNASHSRKIIRTFSCIFLQVPIFCIEGTTHIFVAAMDLMALDSVSTLASLDVYYNFRSVHLSIMIRDTDDATTSELVPR